MNIEKILQSKAKKQAASRPQIFSLAKYGDKIKIKKLLRQGKINHVVDDYLEQLKEYFGIVNANIADSKKLNKSFGDFLSKITYKKPLVEHGNWVYYPWCSTLCHILSEDKFFITRTARNQNLITLNEQRKFYNSIIGIAGLSVGNSVALAIVLQGGGKNIRLADFDNLTLSNLNRIRSGVDSLGLKKVEMTARQIYLINPYAEVEIFNDGINQTNIGKFCLNLNVLVDEVDDLDVKYKLRQQAKKNKIPVIMGADNGDSVIIDIERYDKKPDTAFFHGRLGKLTETTFDQLNKFQTGQTIARLIGLENHTARMLDSLQEMGKSVVSWPQLGGTAMLNGAVIAYCARRIINNQSLEKNRAIISLEQSLQSDYFSKKQKLQRMKRIQAFKILFNL